MWAIGPPKQVTPSFKKITRTSSGEPVCWSFASAECVTQFLRCRRARMGRLRKLCQRSRIAYEIVPYLYDVLMYCTTVVSPHPYTLFVAIADKDLGIPLRLPASALSITLRDRRWPI